MGDYSITTLYNIVHLLFQVKFLPRQDAVGGFLYNEDEKFTGSAHAEPRTFLVWGLTKQNMAECGFADLECVGTQDFAKAIDFTKTDNQQKLEVP